MTSSGPTTAPADWSALLRQAAATLRAAGVHSPRADAELLLSHLLGGERGTLLARVLAGAAPGPGQAEAFGALVERRAVREPLQHITGAAAFHGLTLEVGPGVFVPRPETELLVEEGIRALAVLDGPARVVDLCTGSGAIAAAVAAWAEERHRDVAVTAVEREDAALAWARRNLEPRGVDLRQGDALVACADLDGTVDVVLSNPPYVPDAELPVQAEALADPPTALYGGDAAGLRIPRGIIARAAGLLRPGGRLVMEHHEAQGEALAAEARLGGRFEDVRVLPDHTGRDRFLAAVRTGSLVAPPTDGRMAP
ncbi:peptide chain release factor N(5)-glutamine methyltransferase [Micrococcus porci]|uniref:peptide chain release factor N(5)-glutamine methyltransferase n=1 Tax=Micrococcus porci TaxID=2856555 RepID=UPI003CE9F1F1